MKRPFFFATAALLITAIAVRADTEISADTAKAIKTYTLHNYDTEIPNLTAGDIIKIEFSFRAEHWKEAGSDAFETHLYGTDHGNKATVVVPNDARTWLMKVPDWTHWRAHHCSHNYFVFAKVVDGKNNGKKLELIGNFIETSFTKAVIKWAGQQ